MMSASSCCSSLQDYSSSSYCSSLYSALNSMSSSLEFIFLSYYSICRFLSSSCLFLRSRATSFSSTFFITNLNQTQPDCKGNHLLIWMPYLSSISAERVEMQFLRSSLTRWWQNYSSFPLWISFFALLSRFSITSLVSVARLVRRSSRVAMLGASMKRKLQSILLLQIFSPPCTSMSRMQIYIFPQAYLSAVHDVNEFALVGAIVIAMHLAVLRKDVLLYFLSQFHFYLLELLLSDKVVLPPVHLSLPGTTGGVADAEFKEVGVFGNEVVDESSLHRTIPTLPTPEHPVITKGLCLRMSLLQLKQLKNCLAYQQTFSGCYNRHELRKSLRICLSQGWLFRQLTCSSLMACFMAPKQACNQESKFLLLSISIIIRQEIIT